MLNIKYHNLIKLKLLNKMYTQAEYSKPQRGPQSWHILSFPVHEHYVCGLAKIPVIHYSPAVLYHRRAPCANEAEVTTLSRGWARDQWDG